MTKTGTLTDQLRAADQMHLVEALERLDAAEQAPLIAQLESIPWDEIPALIDEYVRTAPEFELPGDVAPAPYYPYDAKSSVRSWDEASALEAGQQLIRDGKVAAFVVAGGQGTRLGYNGPKGCYPAGAITGKPLFAFFADNLLGARDRFGVRVPFYVMTSPLNHDATVAFFKDQNHFGLDPRDVMFFPQGVMPSFDRETARVLLASPNRIATNPDGHGGSIRALHVSGALDDMKQRGIEHLSYFQVDNPIVNVLDPVFLGLHVSADDSSAQMSSKMVSKAYPEEKVGLFCTSAARTRVIEYSDMPMDRQKETADDGDLLFRAGSIAIHAFSVAFVEKLASDPAYALPYHRADKKVPYYDPKSEQLIQPMDPNAVKLERFVFDALPLAERSIIYETARPIEFAPIKNSEGVDSAESSKIIQTERAALWLERAGVEIPRRDDDRADCTIELSPRTASRAEHLKDADLPKSIARGQRLAL